MYVSLFGSRPTDNMTSTVTNTIPEMEENENEIQDDEIEPDLVVLDPNHVS